MIHSSALFVKRLDNIIYYQHTYIILIYQMKKKSGTQKNGKQKDRQKQTQGRQKIQFRQKQEYQEKYYYEDKQKRNGNNKKDSSSYYENQYFRRDNGYDRQKTQRTRDSGYTERSHQNQTSYSKVSNNNSNNYYYQSQNEERKNKRNRRSRRYKQQSRQQVRNNEYRGKQEFKNNQQKKNQKPRKEQEYLTKHQQNGGYITRKGQGNNNNNKKQLSQYGLNDKQKTLKRIFFEFYPKAKDIKIYVSQYYPNIFFEYYQTSQSHKKVKKYLTQIISQSPMIRSRRHLFQQIFQRIFLKVDKKYYDISVFLIEIALDDKVFLSKSSIFDLGQDQSVMFYYMKGKQSKLNFIIFDRSMRLSEISSKDIQKMARQFPQEYKVYKNFEQKVFEKQQEPNAVDLFENQELQSDQESRSIFKQRKIKELKDQIEDILDNCIDELKQRLQRIEDQIQDQAQINSRSKRYLILKEKQEDLKALLHSFYDLEDDYYEQLKKNKNQREVCQKYVKKLILAQKQFKSGLPIVAKKQTILKMLQRQNLLIVQGQTGSGKSTQLPQILCEFYQLFDNPKAKPVLISQPRRLATRTLAERVAKELGQKVGGFVDYEASGDKKANKNSKILFKLDRIVLDQLTEDPVLSKYSCLVIDQAHERTMSIDVILGLIKKLLKQRNDFKVIVTSASMDIKLFQEYFQTQTLKVSGRLYPVTIIYKNYKNFYQRDKNNTIKNIQKLINQQILTPSGNSLKNEYKGHILCFCSQVEEITKLVDIYERKLNKNMFQVFALHGKITPVQQRKVFDQVGKHKIIFANRIAETAITIDGVKVVIDPGNDIQTYYDQTHKYSCKKLQQISRSSAKQRAGRAGRTGPGYCFRLYSEDSFNKRPLNKIPQIQNCCLQSVVLRLKSLKIKDVINFEYISPPSKEGLQTSLQLLVLIGALTPESEDVTKFGRLLIKIPIEPFLSRAIAESIIFEQILKTQGLSFLNMPQQQKNNLRKYGVKNTVIQILTLIINFSNLFWIQKQQREAGLQNKYYEFSDQEGDFFFLLNIYNKFIQLKKKSHHSLHKETNFRNKELQNWIYQNYLNYKALRQMEQLIAQITHVTKQFYINKHQFRKQLSQTKRKLQECRTFRQVILSCLITSFSANLCKFSNNDHLGYTMVSQKKPLQIYGTSNLNLLGRHPEWIVCHDLFTNQAGRLYCKISHQVTYSFMKIHLDEFVWKKFEIEAIQIKSPFYKEITKEVPTILLQSYRYDYYRSDPQQRFSFLKNSYPLFVEQKNRISFFLQLRENLDENLHLQEDFQNKIKLYQDNVKKQCSQYYKHNYIGNLFISLDDGLQVKDFEFDNREFCYQILGPIQLINQIAEECCEYGKYVIEDSQENKELKKQKKKFVNYKDEKVIKFYIDQIANRQIFERYLTYYSQYIAINQTIVHERRKIPKTKIFMYFFAGTSSKNHLYAQYEFEDYDVLNAAQMCKMIKQGIRNLRGKCKLRDNELWVSNNGRGINIGTSYDQIQITEELERMDSQERAFYSTFKMPKFIKKFREPEFSQARKTNEEWKAQIYNLLEKVRVKNQNVTINIRSSNRKDHEQYMSQFQSTLRVDLIVEIMTLDASVFGKLSNAYQGRKGIIGCQKVHFRIKYEQLLANTSYKSYEALKEQYQKEVKLMSHQLPLLKLVPITKIVRGKQRVFLNAYSPRRQDFVKASKYITSLFSPKLMKLEQFEFRFFNECEEGIKIIKDIEEQYCYDIYFGFQKLDRNLKIYCGNHPFEEIIAKIRQKMKQYKYFTQTISYRGKNLNSVKEIVDRYKKIDQRKNNQALFTYKILFLTRLIEMTGDFKTVEQAKNDILKLVNSDKKSCLICMDMMKYPYKLINCKCSFCWLCLSEHIRDYRNNDGNEKLCCPDDACNKRLNIYDVKSLLSEEQFNTICDLQINKYIKANKEKYLSCNFCENVFDRQQIKEEPEIHCEVCGKIQCSKSNCNDINHTCRQWRIGRKE